MSIAFYLREIIPLEDDLAPCDRVGGLPSHLPPRPPRSAVSGREYCFLAQITSTHLIGLIGWHSLQLYQSGEIDEGDDPAPIAVLVPADAPINGAHAGRSAPSLRPSQITWKPSIEPDQLPVFRGVSDDLGLLLRTKLGGSAVLVDPPSDGARFVCQFTEEPFNLNFTVPDYATVDR
jgi:hypothetical protein